MKILYFQGQENTPPTLQSLRSKSLGLKSTDFEKKKLSFQSNDTEEKDEFIEAFAEEMMNKKTPVGSKSYFRSAGISETSKISEASANNEEKGGPREWLGAMARGEPPKYSKKSYSKYFKPQEDKKDDDCRPQ